MCPGGGKERKAPIMVYGASKKIGEQRNGNKLTFGRPQKPMENRNEEGRKIIGWECDRRPFDPDALTGEGKRNG
jgi:hypothetical protein